MSWLRAALLAATLAFAGCAEETPSVSAPFGPDAACPPMPAACPSPLECTVTTGASGERVCEGEQCCQQFCIENACGACCARAP